MVIAKTLAVAPDEAKHTYLVGESRQAIVTYLVQLTRFTADCLPGEEHFSSVPPRRSVGCSVMVHGNH